jgi:hypothetical protein
MTPEQWQTLQDLFEEVMQEPLSERPSALNRLESGIQDSAVRRDWNLIPIGPRSSPAM